MKINNPIEVYKQKQRKEALKREIEKQRKYFKEALCNLPDFLKKYPLTDKEVFHED